MNELEAANFDDDPSLLRSLGFWREVDGDRGGNRRHDKPGGCSQRVHTPYFSSAATIHHLGVRLVRLEDEDGILEERLDFRVLDVRMKVSENRIGKPICCSLKTKSLQHVTSFPEIPYYFS